MMMVRILLILILLASPAAAGEYQIEMHWTHSGVSMDKFIFQYSPLGTGPWGPPIAVMIENLVPTEDGGQMYWTTTLEVEVNNPDDLQWWRCFGETSWGAQTAISEPAESVRLYPDLGNPKKFRLMTYFL